MERTDMVTGFDERLLDDALIRAVRAPSIHNSQPWRWQVGSGASTSTPTPRGGCCAPTPTAATRS